ncbi:MAG: hypothetical protein JOZ93_01890 [Sinobacteraceae bacterium]|nr:hypothetical protein [Nevskiaceae bacterium]MBV9911292.1 hypothetical protein [Nevskiaceae bacterium]
MHSCRPLPRALLGWLLLAAAAPCTAAEDPCEEFSWDVHHERTLFSRSPSVLSAAKSNTAATAVAPDKLYELHLVAAAQVEFTVPPLGHHSNEHGTYGGLVQLRLPSAGIWRISLSEPDWVDVVKDGAVVQPKDFQGRHGCSAPHKILRYELPAGTALTLQLSAASSAEVRLLVSRDPGGK